MFEVITGTGETVYQGSSWTRALAHYYNHVSLREHVLLWEDDNSHNGPSREWHPTLGHFGTN